MPVTICLTESDRGVHWLGECSVEKETWKTVYKWPCSWHARWHSICWSHWSYWLVCIS